METASRLPSDALALDARWRQPHYVIKERRFTFGRQYRIFTPDGRLVAYCKQKSFKLREDIRFFADESQQVELFRLRATKIIDFSGNFEVIESQTQRVLGFLRRKGWKSILRDEWLVIDAQQQPWGRLREDTGFLSFLRRLLALVDLSFPPKGYHLIQDVGGGELKVAEINERWQIFGDTYDLEFSQETGLDRRVALGLAVCIDAIEGE